MTGRPELAGAGFIRLGDSKIGWEMGCLSRWRPGMEEVVNKLFEV